MVGEEGLDAPLAYQLTAECGRVDEFRTRIRSACTSYLLPNAPSTSGSFHSLLGETPGSGG